jgi:hypothetical protein
MMLLDDRVLRKKNGPMTEEITVGQRKLHNSERQNL